MSNLKVIEDLYQRQENLLSACIAKDAQISELKKELAWSNAIVNYLLSIKNTAEEMLGVFSIEHGK
jgi:hypothetical protein